MTGAEENEAKRIMMQEPLDEWVERVIDRALQRHANETCPLRGPVTGLFERTRKLEIKLASLIAFMAGSGLLGGAAGAALVKALF